MAENEIPINIKVNSDEAEKSIKGLETIFNGFTVAIAAAAGAALAAFSTISKAIDEASESEKVLSKLNIALASTGEFSDQASKDFQNYAKALQQTTTLSDEAVLSAVSLAKNFGISNEQTKKLTSAAIDLAAATGVDLDTAVNQLGGSLSGTAGRLSKLGPAFKGLTEEQLKAGAAIDLVAKRFDGFAEGLSNTFSGALLKAKNNFNDIFESLGNAIINNPVIIAGINAISEAFANFSEFLATNEKAISDFISTSIKFTLSFVRPFLSGIENIIEVLSTLLKIQSSVITGVLTLSDVLLKALEPVTNFILDKFIKAFFAVQSAITTVLSSLVNLASRIPGASEAFKKFGLNLGDFENILDDVATNSIVKFNENNDDLINSINDGRQAAVKFAKEGLLAINDANDAAVDGFKKFEDGANQAIDKILKIESSSKKASVAIKNQNKDIQQSAEEVKKAVEAASKDPAAFAIKIAIDEKALNNFINSTNQQIALGAGVLNSALKGKEGAIDFVSSAAGALADAFLPGVGGIVKEITKTLAILGPEGSKAMVKEFVDAIPDIIIRIADSLPAIVDALIDSLITRGGIIKIAAAFQRAFITAAPNIGVAIVKGMNNAIREGLPNLGGVISDAFKKGVEDFKNGVKIFRVEVYNAIFEGFRAGISGLENFFNNIGSFFANVYENFLNVFAKIKFPKIETPKWVEDLIDFLKSFKIEVPGSGKGGGQGIIKETLGKAGIKLASGGVIPDGYPNDTYPASLTSGEAVLPVDVTKQLADFLNSQGKFSNNSGSNITNALLAQIASHLAQPILVSTTAEIKGKPLADIMLNLSRNNSRTAA